MMKHLSISYVQPKPIWSKVKAAGEGLVANHLRYVNAQCPGLRTLSLHVLALQIEQGLLASMIGNGTAAGILRVISPRLDQLSMVAFGPPNALIVFRESIADQQPWTSGDTPGRLPIREISKRERSELMNCKKANRPVSNDWTIRVWHTFGPRVAHLARGREQMERVYSDLSFRSVKLLALDSEC